MTDAAKVRGRRGVRRIGWAILDGDTLNGTINFHLGDDSESGTKAPVGVKDQGGEGNLSVDDAP